MSNTITYRGASFELPFGHEPRIDLERWLIEELEGLSAEVVIPAYMLGAFVRHVVYGEPTGHFLTAMFENDMMEAFVRADEVNRRALMSYMRALHNAVPRAAHGSKRSVAAWRKLGGMAADPAYDHMKKPAVTE